MGLKIYIYIAKSSNKTKRRVLGISNDSFKTIMGWSQDQKLGGHFVTKSEI